MGCSQSSADRGAHTPADTLVAESTAAAATAAEAPLATGLWAQHRGHEIEPPLRSGAIALLSAKWLVGHASAGGTLLRRQELPPEAFMSFDDLIATGQTTDGLRVIAVSHAWLQPDHPDPRAHNLAVLHPVLDARTRSGVAGDWGVFIE